MEEKKVIKISDVLEMLNTGKTRKDIQTHYGLKTFEIKEIFEHPELKGKKTKFNIKTYELINDLETTSDSEAIIENEIQNTENESKQSILDDDTFE